MFWTVHPRIKLLGLNLAHQTSTTCTGQRCNHVDFRNSSRRSDHFLSYYTKIWEVVISIVPEHLHGSDLTMEQLNLKGFQERMVLLPRWVYCFLYILWTWRKKPHPVPVKKRKSPLRFPRSEGICMPKLHFYREIPLKWQKECVTWTVWNSFRPFLTGKDSLWKTSNWLVKKEWNLFKIFFFVSLYLEIRPFSTLTL